MELVKQNIMLECAPLKIRTQAAAEGEITPPGTMPPIVQILSIDGRTNANAESLDNRMIVDGTVNLGILYVCSSGMVHGFESVALFKHTVDMPGSKPGMRCEVMPSVGEITYRLSSGTLVVNAIVTLDCAAFERCDIPVVTTIDNMPLETQIAEFTSELFASDVDEISIREDARLPRSAEKLLGIGGYIRTQSVSMEGNRAIVEGILRLSLLYLAPDGTLIQTPIMLPFTHIADLPQDASNVNATARFLSLSAAQSDEDIATIEAQLEISVNSRVPHRYEALNDAYSTTDTALECMREEILLNRNQHTDCRCTVRLNAVVPNGMPAADRVLIARFRPQIEWVEAQNATLMVSGFLYSSIVYLDRDGNMHGFDAVLPFECEGEADDMFPGMDVSVTASCELVHAGAAGMEIPLQVALEISADSSYNESVFVVTDAEETERAEAIYGPMIYFPDSTESLWDVGKLFGVSLEDLRKINPELDEVSLKSVLLNMKRVV